MEYIYRHLYTLLLKTDVRERQRQRVPLNYVTPDECKVQVPEQFYLKTRNLSIQNLKYRYDTHTHFAVWDYNQNEIWITEKAQINMFKS